MNTNPPLKELVPVTPRGEATRKKLLAAAEIEFGGQGFPAASVSSITQRADVGQGTFYLYFHSKEEIFATLVRDIGHAQCSHIASSGHEAKPGETVERQLAGQLLEFVVLHPGRHRILIEAQFVDAAVFRETQEKLCAAVADQLAVAGAGDSRHRLRAAALIGASAYAALVHCHWQGQPVSAALVDAVVPAR